VVVVKKRHDSRINVRYAPLKELFVLCFILAAFNGFHMWIYQTIGMEIPV